MSGPQEPIMNTPAASSATAEPTAATTTAAEATTDTSALAPESRPEIIEKTDASTTAASSVPTASNPPKEEKFGKNEVLIGSQSINEGILGHKGPGLVKQFIFSKKYFWFGDEPLEHDHLRVYLSNEKSKEIAHPNAAHASQTGKGLLFYAKRAEDKPQPQGVLNLADMTDISKADLNNFAIHLHGQKHSFQAPTEAERDGWLVALESRAADAKTSRDGIISSSGYKSQLEKYGTPSAAGVVGASRSRSRPNKAGKSRERVASGNTNSNTPATTPIAAGKNTTGTNTGTATVGAGNLDGATSDTTADIHPKNHVAEQTAGAVVGAAAVGTAAHKASEDNDKIKDKKSRSRSRGNKRSSLFGGLMSKKEDSEEKKMITKEEKEEKKEEKAEDKALKHEAKQEEKAEKKAEKEEHKEEKQIEKELKHEGAGKLDAAGIASRVVGEPVVPAPASSIHHTGAAETTPAAAETTSTAGGAPLASGTAASMTTGTNPIDAGHTPSTAAGTTPTSTARETAPKPSKRTSIFGGLFNKKDATTPSANEAGPAVPAKDEPSSLPSTAPQLDKPVNSPAAGATTAPKGPTLDTTAPVTNSPATASATTPKDNRRSSFFSGLGTKKERRTGGTSGDELTDGEGKKQVSGGFGGLLRKASRAQPKNTSGAAVTDPADLPLPKETPAATGASTNGLTTAEKSGLAPGEVGSNAMADVHESTPVQAAA